MPRGSAPFDAKILLSIVGGGTSKEYRKKQTIFAQGAPAYDVFYIQKGRVKLSIVSKQGKEAVIAILGVGDFSAKDALQDSLFASRPLAP